MTNIKINGVNISDNNNIKNTINSLDFSFKEMEKYYNTVKTYNGVISSETLTGAVVTIWDAIINFFKHIFDFLANILRSKVYAHRAKKIIEMFEKIKVSKENISKLNWYETIKAPKSILADIQEIENLVDEIDDDERALDTGDKLKHNKISLNIIRTIEEIQKKTNGEYELPIIETLEILSKRDIGAPQIEKNDDSEIMLNSLIKYLRCYENNSSSRIKALIRIKDKSYSKLRRAIRRKEKKMEDEDIIDSYRKAVEISNICFRIYMKNINFVFIISKTLIKNFYNDTEKK